VSERVCVCALCVTAGVCLDLCVFVRMRISVHVRGCACMHSDGQEIAVPLDPSNPASQAGRLTKRFADSIMAIQVEA
jgi:hypothetical protein